MKATTRSRQYFCRSDVEKFMTFRSRWLVRRKDSAQSALTDADCGRWRFLASVRE
jgi:hypothetical protein